MPNRRRDVATDATALLSWNYASGQPAERRSLT